MENLVDLLISSTEIFANIATVLSLVGVFLVFKQLRQGQKISTGANTIDLVKHLQEEETRSARYHCLQYLKDKSVSEYSETDRINASLVCSSYDLAGIFIRNGYASSAVVIGSWGPSIVANYDVLESYIISRRATSGDRFWADFEWLADRARSFEVC